MKEDGFILRESQGVRYYSCQAFDVIPRLRHGFSTRDGGTDRPLNLGDRPWDSVERVHENRQRFLAAIDFSDSTLATLRQVHSNRAYIIKDNSGEWNPSEGDALMTTVEGIALAVQVADCMPVLIADPVKGIVAAVHSGWRGTLSRILFQTISRMQHAFQSSPADLRVAMGPGIRKCCFEVGEEVKGLFDREYTGFDLTAPIADRPGKHFLDLIKALEIQLDLAGVLASNRYDLHLCTCCHTSMFFSHRAEGSAAGRMLAVIGFSSQ